MGVDDEKKEKEKGDKVVFSSIQRYITLHTTNFHYIRYKTGGYIYKYITTYMRMETPCMNKHIACKYSKAQQGNNIIIYNPWKKNE